MNVVSKLRCNIIMYIIVCVVYVSQSQWLTLYVFNTYKVFNIIVKYNNYTSL